MPIQLPSGKLALNPRRPLVFASRQALFSGLAALLLLAGGAVRPMPAHGQERPSILLLPVVVHSSESPAYLRNGLSDMLMARFQQADRFELMQALDPAQATTDLDEAIQAARSRGADFVLFGSFTRFGEGASLDMHAASAQPTSPEDGLRAIFVHSGQIGEVIPNLDDLVGKVTRFAIEDFAAEPLLSEGEASEVSHTPGSPADLRARVRKLEQAIENLQRSGTDLAH